MSFTTDVCEELISLPLTKSCCKKALLEGLFWNAICTDTKGGISAVFRTAHAAEHAAFMLESRYGAAMDTLSLEELVRAGRRYYRIDAVCGAISKMLTLADSDDKRPIWELLGFRCGNCRASFLRGVFIAIAAVNDPHKGYHLEFVMPEDRAVRSERLYGVLSASVCEPKLTKRGTGVGLYYKTNGAISDLIYYIGGTKSSFEVANTWVERDIRNNENRATNCVARNISRAVEASQKHISAIELLKSNGKIDTLPDELRVTAELRVAYDSASLSELALMQKKAMACRQSGKTVLVQKMNKNVGFQKQKLEADGYTKFIDVRYPDEIEKMDNI